MNVNDLTHDSCENLSNYLEKGKIPPTRIWGERRLFENLCRISQRTNWQVEFNRTCEILTFRYLGGWENYLRLLEKPIDEIKSILRISKGVSKEQQEVFQKFEQDLFSFAVSRTNFLAKADLLERFRLACSLSDATQLYIRLLDARYEIKMFFNSDEQEIMEIIFDLRN